MQQKYKKYAREAYEYLNRIFMNLLFVFSFILPVWKHSFLSNWIL